MDLFKTKKKKDAKQTPALAPATPPQPQANGRASAPVRDEDGWEIRAPQEQNLEISASRSRSTNLEDLAAVLQKSVPLAQLPEVMTRYALEMEQDIADYLNCNNAETQEKYLIAQDVLRYGLEKSPELIDEAYLQVFRLMQGKTTTSVRGWELLLLLACASRPSNRYSEMISNFVHGAAHATSQWPTTTSILAKRTWTILKHTSKAGRRVNVPLVGEIASVLNNKTLKVQVSFVDGSSKPLSYDWTTTVSSAVEQLANDIGLKNYQDYTLFEARKVPKKLDKDGQFSTATLPPDSYLLLEDHRRIADVVHDYQARGAENKLLLKRRRFDNVGADFSKPQFIALTESHRAAMDEKIAEVANLTLRLREMSGQVMWFENLQAERTAEIAQLKSEIEHLKASYSGSDEGSVSVQAARRERDALIQERDELMDQVKQLKAGDLLSAELSERGQVRVLYETGDSLKNGYDDLRRQLDRRNEEIATLKAAYQNADRILMSSDHQHDAELAQLHIGLEEKEQTVKDLNHLVEKLTTQLSMYENQERTRDSWQSNTDASLSGGMGGLYSQERAAESAKQLNGIQEAYQRQAEERDDLEAELDKAHLDLKEKTQALKQQEKIWRSQLNAAKAETATMKSKLKANDAALAEATRDLEQLHAEAGQLRAELETKEQESEGLLARVREAEMQGMLGESDSARSTAAAADMLIDTLRVELEEVSQERDAVREKLQVIQSLMTGSIMNTNNSNSGSEYSRKGKSSRRFTEPRSASKTDQSASRQSFDSTSDMSDQRVAARARRKAQRVIVDPLSIGKDPRRESIGGAAAPAHLKNAMPLRVLPEDKRQYGTRHPLFAPNYVQQMPMLRDAHVRRDDKNLRKEAAAMLAAADAKRRTFKNQEREEGMADDLRPAPAAVTDAQVTDNINRGTHLLGLLNNRSISPSQDGAFNGFNTSGLTGKSAELPGRIGMFDGQSPVAFRNDRSKLLNSHNSDPVMQTHQSFTSTQSEPELMRSYDGVPAS